MMRLLNEAKGILCDPERRKAYDARRKAECHRDGPEEQRDQKHADSGHNSGTAKPALRQNVWDRFWSSEAGLYFDSGDKQRERQKRQDREQGRGNPEAPSANSSSTSGGDEEGTIKGCAAAILASFIFYMILGILLPRSVGGALIKMLGTVGFGMGLFRWAKAGRTVEVIWIVLFVVDGLLGMRNGIVSQMNREQSRTENIRSREELLPAEKQSARYGRGKEDAAH